jgi:ribosome maturation factor RimP
MLKKRSGKKENRYPGERVFAVDQDEVIKEVKKIASPLCEDEGIRLLHVEFQREPGGKILRLYIDKSGGVDLEDCVNISRQLSDILDIRFETKGSYRLEVSSPGSERPLQEKKDFEEAIGQMLRIRTSKKTCSQKVYKGILKEVSEHSILLLKADEVVAIPFEGIIRARIVENSGEHKC